MKTYCLDIIIIIFFILICGYIIINKTNEKINDIQEQQIIEEGYLPTNLKENELLYESSNIQECIEYNNKFYCY